MRRRSSSVIDEERKDQGRLPMFLFSKQFGKLFLFFFFVLEAAISVAVSTHIDTVQTDGAPDWIELLVKVRNFSQYSTVLREETKNKNKNIQDDSGKDENT